MVWCGGDAGGRGIAEAYCAAAEAAVRAADPDAAFLPAMPHAPFTLGGGDAAAVLPSYPEPRAVATYLGAHERNISHPACTFHESPPGGTVRVFEGFIRRFLMPSGFENTLWLSQIQQGLALKQHYEAVRVGERPAAGFVFWHLNDAWPTCSPSSLDAGGRWKAPHYMARRFFAPLWLCGAYRSGAGTVDVYVVNDSVKPFKGECHWRLTLMDGTVAAEGAKKAAAAPAARERAVAVKVGDWVRKAGAGNLLLWLYLLDEQGNQTSSNFVMFCDPRELALQPPCMRAEIRAWDDNSFAVTLTSRHPAMWVWISLDGMDARYDENFFCMEPEKPVRVRVTPAVRLKLDAFRQIVRIGSLRDTWQDKRALMQMMTAQKKS